MLLQDSRDLVEMYNYHYVHSRLGLLVPLYFIVFIIGSKQQVLISVSRFYDLSSTYKD